MSRVAALAALLALTWNAAEEPRRQTLDSFDGIAGWIAAPSESVRLALSPAAGEKGSALRLDFDFQGHGGWAAARKAFPRVLPENWVFTLRLKGDAPPETLEFKLLDATGQNVWWSARRDFAFPRDWTTLSIRKRQVSFAWGPARGGDLRELGFVEITVTAGTGGRGTVWIDELALEPLPAHPTPLPPPRSWDGPAASGEAQDLRLDLGGRHELGGLALDWDAEDFARRYTVEISADGASWAPARAVSATRGGRAWIYLPDAEAAFVRLRCTESARRRGYRLRRIEILAPELAETPTKFLESVARVERRGLWPRSLIGEQVYWTLVGVDGGAEKALLSEDGALEVGRGAFSLEPFLRAGGKLLGWNEAEISQTLAGGDLPLPGVTRKHRGGLELSVAALADGPPDASTLRARYRVANTGAARVQATLYLAARPVQVNPPWQLLSTIGGFAPLFRVAWDGRVAKIGGDRRVVALTAPSRFGASPFADGEIVSRLDAGAFAPASAVSDPDGLASAAFAWDLDLPPGGARDVVVAVPLGDAAAVAASDTDAGTGTGAGAPADFERRLSAARQTWREKLDRVSFTLPPEAAAIAGAARSNLGWILVNRDGPAIRPGSRSYARSWIRDGALTSAALLRLGHAGAARDFLRWYAPYQFASGAVPCCVGPSGADPVAENDSHGELLYLAAEYFRFTGDRATLEQVWPYLSRAAAYIDRRRRERRTEEYRSGPKRLFFGLLPESISHEGYSDHPVHSYWDDFWALRGLSDAAELASTLGRAGEGARLSASRDQMREDVEASIRGVIAACGIDYVPGSADLADLDPTSTTIALEPAGEGSRLPRRELSRTFDRYWERFLARRADRTAPGADYTPYEWRVAGSFVRLGQRERSQALFDFFLADRRPVAWNQWGEVVWPDPRTPKFIGDMPHGWVGSDFIRSFLDLFAYDREEDGALVLGAGVPAAWLADPRGVAVSGLRTRYGRLDLAMHAGDGAVRVRVAGRLSVPLGGFVVPWPLEGKAVSATVNGRPAAVPASGDLVVREVPADVVLKADR